MAKYYVLDDMLASHVAVQVFPFEYTCGVHSIISAFNSVTASIGRLTPEALIQEFADWGVDMTDPDPAKCFTSKRIGNLRWIDMARKYMEVEILIGFSLNGSGGGGAEGDYEISRRILQSIETPGEAMLCVLPGHYGVIGGCRFNREYMMNRDLTSFEVFWSANNQIPNTWIPFATFLETIRAKNKYVLVCRRRG